MSMSDDIAGATLQTSAKLAETSFHIAETSARIATSSLHAIFRLLRELAMINRGRKNAAESDVHNTEIPEINGGEISMKELLEHCRKNGEPVVTSEQGLTKSDANTIAAKAKEYGMPIAFSNQSGENLYANVRQGDLPVFKQICTEVIKDKLDIRPQELGNFKCQKWEIPFINAELQSYDLSAQFAETRNGEFFAMYEKSDEKAIKIARSEFLRKCNEVENDIKITDKDEEGFYTLKDTKTGKEIDLDGVPNRKIIAEKVQEEFGYDENKANIVAAKFGQEMLSGKEKQRYFSDSAISEFSYISKANWENENILTKAYDCYYVTPKTDSASRVVYQNEEGQFAILTPHKQRRSEMSDILRTQLGITDTQELNALIDKAEHVNIMNSKVREVTGFHVDLHKEVMSFEKSDFDMTNPEVVSNMRREDENGNVFVKTQPFDIVSSDIKRNGNEFTVTSTVTSTETDQNGQSHSTSQSQQLILSFSNKKTALQELREMYKNQGVPDYAAKEMAKNVFNKAEWQNVESVLSVEKRTSTGISVSDGTNIVHIPTAEREQAIEMIKEKFDVPTEYAETVIDKSHDVNIQMQRNDFIELGLIIGDKNAFSFNDKFDNNYEIAYNSTEIKNGDQSWNETDYLLSKDGHFYLFYDNGYDTDERKYFEISDERAKEILSDEKWNITEQGEKLINNETVDTDSNEEISLNGHEMHPEGNMLESELASSPMDNMDDMVDNVADSIEDCTSSIGGR